MSKNSKKEISSGMFIPLHYSNLYKVVPEGENIIYSLYYKANLFEWGPFSTRKIWHTHLLITTNGLYFGWYQKRKPPNVKFVNWLAVKKFSRSKIKIKRAIYHLKPKRERNFETRRDFRNRKKDVSNHVKEIMRKGKEKTLSERYSPVVQYVDIKKGEMKNQVNSHLLDLLLIYVFLIPILIFLSVRPHILLNYLGIISLCCLIFYLGVIGFHRGRVIKRNYELSQLEEIREGEGKKLLHRLEYKEKQALKESKLSWNQRRVLPYFLCKIAILGDENVGRSTLARDYLNSHDYDPYFIIGVNFANKDIAVNNRNVKFQIWFLSNFRYHEEFYTQYLRGTLGAIIFYDITNINSFANVPKWIQTIKENSWSQSKGDFPIILVGNKMDLERERVVSEERGNELKERYGLSLFMEVSLKTGEGVNAIFEELANLIFKRTFS